MQNEPELPDNIETLKRLVRESREAIRDRDIQIEHLKLMLAKLVVGAAIQQHAKIAA